MEPAFDQDSNRSKKNVSMLKKTFSEQFFPQNRSSNSTKVFMYEEFIYTPVKQKNTVFSEKYDLLGTVGEGTVGTVKKCKDKVTGQVFAVKVIKKRDSELVTSIKNEFLHLKNLKHPNIVAAKEFYIDSLNGEVMLVMEYFESSELLATISELGHYSEYVAKYLFRQILEGICYLHRNGVVHRDLKPNNILVSKGMFNRILSQNHRFQRRKVH